MPPSRFSSWRSIGPTRVLNLARAGDPLAPGRRHRVRVALNQIAHAFAAGSRIRLAISTAYSLVWPSPVPVRLVLFTGASVLEREDRVQRRRPRST